MTEWNPWSDNDEAEFVRLVPRAAAPEVTDQATKEVTKEVTDEAARMPADPVLDPTEAWSAEFTVSDGWPTAADAESDTGSSEPGTGSSEPAEGSPPPVQRPKLVLIDDWPADPPSGTGEPAEASHGTGAATAGRQPTIVIDAENPVDLTRPTPEGKIDKRISERRIDVKKATRRARLIRVGTIALVAGLLVGGTWFLSSPYFDVKQVDLTGVQYSDEASIATIVNGLRGESMWRVDLESERASIAKQPWVRRVSIRRDWPDRIIVDIAERRPVASYPALDGEWRIVDVDGRVLTSIQNQPRDFPPVVANQTPADPGEQTGPTIVSGAKVAQALPAELKVRLSEIRVNDALAVELHLFDQGVVLLGPAENLPREADQRAHSARTLRRQTGRIDRCAGGDRGGHHTDRCLPAAADLNALGRLQATKARNPDTRESNRYAGPQHFPGCFPGARQVLDEIVPTR